MNLLRDVQMNWIVEFESFQHDLFGRQVRVQNPRKQKKIHNRIETFLNHSSSSRIARVDMTLGLNGIRFTGASTTDLFLFS